MAIVRIMYMAANCNMGETTDQDCENYRAWAYNEIEKAYPGACIGVYNSDRGSSCCSNSDYWKEQDNEEIACYEFLAGLWDRCPWSGEFFE